MSQPPSSVLLALFAGALIALFLTTYFIKAGQRNQFLHRTYDLGALFATIIFFTAFAGRSLNDIFIELGFYTGFASIALFLLSLRGRLASLALVHLQSMLLQRRVVYLTVLFLLAGLVPATMLNLSPPAAMALALTLAWIPPALCIAHLIVDLLSLTCRRYGIH